MTEWYIYFLSELVGSILLTFIGGAIMANIFLKGTIGSWEKNNTLRISFGWAAAVVVAVVIGLMIGGQSHINMAITMMYIVAGWTKFVGALWLIPIFLGAQILGFIIGGLLLTILYWESIKKTASDGFGANVVVVYTSLAATKSKKSAMLNEFFSMAIFLVGFAFMVGNYNGILAKGTSFVFLFILVLGVGLAFSGITPGGINPTKDLVMRMILHLLPIEGKGDTNMKYSWIPVIMPNIAGIVVGIGLRFLG
ncbi:hypothetical protein [[Acholeplasma] multilocale]|uniref:hypothetical protein n=1 Tax=[Acholeplasma] multilocale TaxID=264638 RepID=UPI00047B8F47|nr:hypothetical protein [[Acholeplasma] multilocale]